jgi:hypothetical protein
LEIALRNCIVWGSIEIRCWNGVRKGEWLNWLNVWEGG